MGATNHTTNYSLPQFVGSDKPSWLTDINGAFEDIDDGMKANADAAAGAAGDVASLGSRVTTAEGNITSLQGSVGTLNGKMASAETKIGSAALDTTAQNLSGAVNEINAKFDPVLIWTNPDLTQEVGSRFISMDLTDYRELIIECKTSTGLDSYETIVLARKGVYTALFAWTRTMLLRRDFMFRDVGINFAGGHSSSSVSSSTENNAILIPAYIYGIK